MHTEVSNKKTDLYYILFIKRRKEGLHENIIWTKDLHFLLFENLLARNKKLNLQKDIG